MRNSTWADENAADIFSYEMLLLREMEEHAHMWQTPALALTAQAFLLTISLDQTEHWLSRAVTACLGAAIAAMSVQLMAKHRFHNELDRLRLTEIEERIGIEAIARRGWAYGADHQYYRTHPPKRGLVRFSSANLWQRGLVCFVLVNVGILAWALADSPWLTDGASWPW